MLDEVLLFSLGGGDNVFTAGHYRPLAVYSQLRLVFTYADTVLGRTQRMKHYHMRHIPPDLQLLAYQAG